MPTGDPKPSQGVRAPEDAPGTASGSTSDGSTSGGGQASDAPMPAGNGDGSTGGEAPTGARPAKKASTRKAAGTKAATSGSTSRPRKKAPTKKAPAKKAGAKKTGAKAPAATARESAPERRPADAVAPVATPTSPRRADPVAPVATPTSQRPAEPLDVTGEFWGEDERRSHRVRGDRERPQRAGVERPDRRGRRARRVHRVVRNVSVWSVLKVSVIFYICAWVIVLIAGVVLWQLSDQAGLIGNMESFWAEATGQATVEWDGSALLRSWLMAGGVLALASAGLTTLFAVLFNLICDLTGGVRFTVLELEPTPRQRRGRTRASGGDRR